MQAWRPRRCAVDVKETSEGYEVHAELPGMKKEDIHVHIDGPVVSISAERKQEKEVKEGEKVLRTERYFGKVSRSFQLGQEIDEAQGGRQVQGRRARTFPAEEGGGPGQAPDDRLIRSPHAGRPACLLAGCGLFHARRAATCVVTESGRQHAHNRDARSKLRAVYPHRNKGHPMTDTRPADPVTLARKAEILAEALPTSSASSTRPSSSSTAATR